MDDQEQDVQRPECRGQRVEMDFEQAGSYNSGRVLQIEARVVSSRVHASTSTARCNHFEWYNARDETRATSTQDDTTHAARRSSVALAYCYC